MKQLIFSFLFLFTFTVLGNNSTKIINNNLSNALHKLQFRNFLSSQIISYTLYSDIINKHYNNTDMVSMAFYSIDNQDFLMVTIHEKDSSSIKHSIGFISVYGVDVFIYNEYSLKYLTTTNKTQYFNYYNIAEPCKDGNKEWIYKIERANLKLIRETLSW